MFQEHSEAIRLVVLWSCAIVFVATSFLTVLSLRYPAVIANPKIRDWLHKGLIVEIVVIGVGFFSHLLGEQAGAREEFEKTRESIEALEGEGPVITLDKVRPYLESSGSFEEATAKLSASTDNIWTVEASVAPFSDGPNDSESLFHVNVLISDRDEKALGDIQLATNAPTQEKTLFIDDDFLGLTISAGSQAGPGPGDERATINSTLHIAVKRGDRIVTEKDFPLSLSTIYHLGAPDMADSRGMSLGTVIREEVLDTAP